MPNVRLNKPDSGFTPHAVRMMLSDLRLLPSEDHRYGRFGETCRRSDGCVADAGLLQFLDVAQHKRDRNEPAAVPCALRRRA